MEGSKNATGLTYETTRILFLLNAIIWLIVCHITIYQEEEATFVSYFSVLLTVLVFQKMKNISAAFTYFLNFISKILIIVGISLVIFSKFWDTAFYLTCLGILIQKMIHDMKLKALNANPRVQSVASGELKQAPLLSLNVTQDENIDDSKINESNKGKYIESVIENVLDDMLLQSTPANENTDKMFPLEIKSTDKECDKLRSDELKALNKDKEFSDKYFEWYCQEPFEKSGIENNDKISNDSSIELKESLQNCNESLFQSKMTPNYVDVEARVSSSCDLDVKISNLQEFALKEFSEIKAEFDLDVTDIEREIEKEIADTYASEQSLASNDISEKDIKLLAESETCSSEEFDKLGSRKFLRCQKKKQDSHIQENEMKKYKNKYYESLLVDLLNKMLLKSTRENESTEENLPLEIPNTYKEFNKPYSDVSEVLNKDGVFSVQDFQIHFKEQFDKSGIMHESNNKVLNGSSIELSESLSACSETLRQFEMHSNCVEGGEIKKVASLCAPKVQILNIRELDPSDLLKIKTVLDLDETDIEQELEENKVLGVADMDTSVKHSFSSSKSSELEDSSKINDLGKHVEDRNVTKESLNEALEDEGESCSSISNVEDAVNRIDSSFIYALGFNAPL